ncbi:cell division cycle protein 20 homolog B isoform X2 [Acanthochromis polyacanthus]|uniref:cell division cycle protein 20 homolog B isoform X2 n=1 Tax=Acanthochromis polyacanthus TaxID=80966 RepID=UPI0022346F47|nr:cell division cycle protein 20 homolog B isoform X2 [Acanthochromis polyacanthus]
MEMQLKTGNPHELEEVLSHDASMIRRMLTDFTGKRRHRPSEEQLDAHQLTYKRFRSRIQRNSRQGPAVSTPVAPWRQQSFEFDPVCQQLQLDSPPKNHESAQRVLQDKPQEAALARGMGVDSCSKRRENTPTGSGDRRHDLQPFDVLNEAPVNLQGKSVMKLLAPSLLNDYYTNLLDCSCDGLVALALGSSVYIWNSETRALVGHLDPQLGRPHRHSISSLCWSRDGRALCIGTRRGQIQLWDVEQKQSVRCLLSHLSVVGGLSWKQQLLSSGSVLGHIHHLDPRASTPLVGAAVQKEAICSLQWSPEDDCLASGSTEGHLRIWDGDITGVKRSRQPVTTVKQPSAVKAMGWCPWQRQVIATGGGWNDGELRMWDTLSGSCLTSISTNSQICSLRWAEKKRYLITSHGLPHHQVARWRWEFPSISPITQLTGHSHRVLHLAVNPDNTQIFSAGADQRFHIWDL